MNADADSRGKCAEAQAALWQAIAVFEKVFGGHGSIQTLPEPRKWMAIKTHTSNTVGK